MSTQHGESLFDHVRRTYGDDATPLATRMRPRSLAEFAGQEHLLGEGRVLERSIHADRVPSMILWGPPGSGKTTLARLIAGLTSKHFVAVSAVTSGVADLRKAAEEARDRRSKMGQDTILFVDEVHRFNKAQQDAILPHVEDGTVTFIGATTENPSFEVISALLSRCRVFTLKALADEQMASIIDRAAADAERGLGRMRVMLSDEARQLLIAAASGDARIALNTLELAAQIQNPGDDARHIDADAITEAIQHRAATYDKGGDAHYDTISAFIKSIRASDPDAAVYWLARMLESGEDPLFIARRIVIAAAEDIGMADPQALPVAVAAQQAVHFIGLPEGAIPLAQATVYLATAPKSNSSYLALNEARKEVQTGKQHPVPLHLRNAVTGLMKASGYGKGYKYAHDYEGHFAGQANLPDELAGQRFYRPSGQGYEAEVARRVAEWQRITEGDSPQKDDIR